MADIVAASAAGGLAQLIFEVNNLGILTAIRIESSVNCSADITIAGGRSRSFDMRAGMRRINLAVNRQFLLDSTSSPLGSFELRAIH